ncbi:hypothetical protein ASA1KI_11050 [Opitutales bacterium ASA1]|nr:hypothetical protein ASA1KI_11050 [Opitutales bacterium ASA1]
MSPRCAKNVVVLLGVVFVALAIWMLWGSTAETVSASSHSDTTRLDLKEQFGAAPIVDRDVEPAANGIPYAVSPYDGSRIMPRASDLLSDPEFREQYRVMIAKEPPSAPILYPEELEQLGLTPENAVALLELGDATRATLMARFAANADIAAPSPDKRIVDVALSLPESQALRDSFYSEFRRLAPASVIESPENRQIVQNMEGRLYDFGKWPLTFSFSAQGAQRIEDALSIGHITFVASVVESGGRTNLSSGEVSGNWNIHLFRFIFGELADRVLVPSG